MSYHTKVVVESYHTQRVCVVSHSKLPGWDAGRLATSRRVASRGTSRAGTRIAEHNRSNLQL